MGAGGCQRRRAFCPYRSWSRGKTSSFSETFDTEQNQSHFCIQMWFGVSTRWQSPPSLHFWKFYLLKDGMIKFYCKLSCWNLPLVTNLSSSSLQYEIFFLRFLCSGFVPAKALISLVILSYSSSNSLLGDRLLWRFPQEASLGRTCNTDISGVNNPFSLY